MRRALLLIHTAILATALAGCGGGAGGVDPAPGGTPVVAGKVTGAVTQINDDTSALAGVQIRMIETGEVVTSAPDGGFDFVASSPRSFTLALVTAPLLGKRGADDGEEDAEDDQDGDDDEIDDGDQDGDDDEIGDDDDGDEDEIDDGDESSETEVEVHRVEDGEHIHVRLRIRDGRLEQVEVSRSGHDEREVEVFMDRAATSDDADIKGKLEVEIRDDRQRLEVEAEHATAGRDLELFVLAPDGTEQSLGVLSVDSFGEAEWEISTEQGGVLPLGAGSVEDLVDHTVEVRDAVEGIVLLIATVPDVPASVPSPAPDGDGDDDDEEDGDGDDEDDARARGRSPLVPQIDGLGGYVEIRSRPEDSRERFKIEAEQLAGFTSVEFFLEDGLGLGTFSSLGVQTVDVEGEAELKLDTADGDVLPNCAIVSADLVGLGVEVRDAATGNLLLTGTVPALTQED